MSIQHFTEKTELHNESVREIMAQIPGWIIRWGLTVLFGIVMIVILGSYFIRFPETVTIPVRATEGNSSSAVISNVGGNIEHILIKEGDLIKPGDTIATLAPFSNKGVSFQIVIPSDRRERIKIGQSVNIKLSDYPYKEYGLLKGRVESIVRSKEGYVAEIGLPDGLMTSYGKKLTINKNMGGTADIVVDEKRLITRFIKPMKGKIERMKE